MPYRAIVHRELTALLSLLAHPARLALVEALEAREQGVGSLAHLVGVSHSAASQHLALFRAHRIVQERREGRHVLYRLTTPQLAAWLADGLAFVEAEGRLAIEVNEAVKTARAQRSKGQVARKVRP